MSFTAQAPLTELHGAKSASIRQAFETTGDGFGAIRQRSQLVDEIVAHLYHDLISQEGNAPRGFCLVAVGGYGRQELFPYSDIDLLFLSQNSQAENKGSGLRDAIAALARTLWDLRLRASHSARTLPECSRLQRDNLEFSISLLDCRYLAGDPSVFARLHDQAVPQLMARDRKELVGDLAEMTRKRHEKYGGTVFHLEPNLKETPGGLRDYHVCRWLAQIAELDRTSLWVNPEEQWPLPLRGAGVDAFRFLAATRCFLHYSRGRDDNALTYELQDQAASIGTGLGLPRQSETLPGSSQNTDPLVTAEWMRTYFRHARSIDSLTAQLLDAVTPARSSLYNLFQDWRSRLSNADFSVLRGKIFPRQTASASGDVARLLSMFEMIARHGLELSLEAENWSRETLDRLSLAADGLRSGRAAAETSTRPEVDTTSRPEAGIPTLSGSTVWRSLRGILLLPHAPLALRAMHRLGILGTLFPEFRAIDALVIRDFYHRYTVDEHSFMTIQNLHELAKKAGVKTDTGKRAVAGGRLRPKGAAPNRSSDLTNVTAEDADNWGHKFSEIFAELEQPERLFLSLLFHDVGKGMPGDNHLVTGLQAFRTVMTRLDLNLEEREAVCFLIGHHLEMSRTLQRRDIFDIETIRAFADKVGTLERLKMLCLFTYADIKAVNPEALSPWKAEMLWRLYVATANYLTRGLDQERVPGDLGSRTRVPNSVHAQGDAAEATELSGPRAEATQVIQTPEQPSWSSKIEQTIGILARPSSAGGSGLTPELPDHLRTFLEGFPKRYLETHSSEEIAEHFRLAQRLTQQSVQITLRGRKNLFDLTVLTPDRPFLFALLTGTLAAWGMNILKADAFSNATGLVLDTFRFVDLYQTLELNPSESRRFEESVVQVLSGELNLLTLMARRAPPQGSARPKIEIPTQMSFDNSSSSHSTLLELIAQDRAGLLYRVSSVIAERGCNIEVALVDTEGEKVIDVFYLTSGGVKLDLREQKSLREALLARIATID